MRPNGCHPPKNPKLPPQRSKVCSRCKVHKTARCYHQNGMGRLNSLCKLCHRDVSNRGKRERYWNNDAYREDQKRKKREEYALNRAERCAKQKRYRDRVRAGAIEEAQWDRISA